MNQRSVLLSNRVEIVAMPRSFPVVLEEFVFDGIISLRSVDIAVSHLGEVKGPFSGFLGIVNLIQAF